MPDKIASYIFSGAAPEGIGLSNLEAIMDRSSRKYDASAWTGKHDPIAPWALAIVLAMGAIGFLIIGAIIF